MINLIESQEKLEELLNKLSNLEYVAIDTEFDSHTGMNYFPKLSTIQICFEENGIQKFAIIDALSSKINNKKSLIEFFLSKKIIKIFHSAINDIGVLYGYLGIEIVNIFDTQIAYSMQKITKTPTSYASLVLEFCNEEINKTHQNARWMRRPLSDSMLEYALSDVKYLLPIYKTLKQRLIEKQNYVFFCEEMENLHKNIASRANFSYKKQNIDDSLSLLEKTRISILAKHREKMALNLNINPEIIIPDSLLLKFAKLTYAKLKRVIEEENPALMEFLGKILESHWDKPDKTLDSSEFARDITKIHSSFHAIDNKIKEVSVKNNISKFVIASGNELKLLSKMKTLDEKSTIGLERIFSGWRYEVFGKYVDFNCNI